MVTNWDFVNNLDDPERRDTVMLETRTWYGIPHSVTIGIVGRGDKLYIHAHSDENRMQTPFPNDKLWTRNVSRDPRVRLKIGDKIYEATVALMTDRDEVAEVMGRDPVTVERGPDGREHVKSVMHYWRVFQSLRNFENGGLGLVEWQAPTNHHQTDEEATTGSDTTNDLRGTVQVDEVVRMSDEETLNAMLDAEADQLCRAQRYDRSSVRTDTRA